MAPDESGYDDSSTPSVSVVLLVSLLGRILVTSSSLPIVGACYHSISTSLSAIPQLRGDYPMIPNQGTLTVQPPQYQQTLTMSLLPEITFL